LADEREASPEAPREPLAIELLKMDLDAAKSTLNRHDLDDDRSLSKNEFERLGWQGDEVKRFDLNRSGDLPYIEVALKLGDKRIDDGIVQMDDTLAQRYTAQYDANRDGKLSLEELQENVFTDQLDAFDRNSDGELSSVELLRGLAFERRFRTELGIKGCDQGGAMKLINRGDQDGDKRIDADELPATGLASKTMDLDRNDDGKLTVSELAECLASRRNRLGLTPSDQLNVRSLMRQLDGDGDGQVVVAELLSPNPESPLSKADTNGDGKITELELETEFGKTRKELGFDDDDAKRARVLIQRNDSDGNRKLSKSELTASGADRNSPLSPTKLSRTDQDKDGEIDARELAKSLNLDKQRD
jgi:Ca2+-binding EF-hand superfamily protein